MSEPSRPLVLEARGGSLSGREVAQVAAALREGSLVAFPTDTVYGIAANAASPEAVNRLLRAKGRREEKGLPLLLADAEEAPQYAREASAPARRLMERFWPGPLTIVLRRTEAVCAEAVGGGDTVALRVPGHDLARRIIREAKGPVAVSSANRAGASENTSGEGVLAALGAWLSVLVDGGTVGGGVPSTVIDMTPDRPRVLRWGAVTREQLVECLGDGVDEGAPL